MSVILSLDTSTKVCSVALHESGDLIGHQSYHLQKSHSSLLPVIIEELLANCEMTMDHVEAIALAAGPGSYTGLRIGTATAKGLAFTLGIPLIALDTLDSMLDQVVGCFKNETYLCPMIDARRMEVYCKLVTAGGDEIWPTAPVIVEADTFSCCEGRPLVLFGNGAEKLRSFLEGSDYLFIDNIHPNAAYMGKRAYARFQQRAFEDLAYFEPEYLKEYRTNTPSQKFKV